MPRPRVHQLETEGSPEGTTLAVSSSDELEYVSLSVPVILLPAGSTAADVPAGTPIGTIVLVKA
jgi:hypothetical protein